MQTISSGFGQINYRIDGLPDGHPVMFANSLGTDLRVWDLLIEVFPEGYRFIRYDKRGHGLSDCPTSPYSISDLVDDAETVAEAIGISGFTFVGLSIGGLIGQGLVQKRPELINKLVLMDTAAKIGTTRIWNERIASIKASGLAAISDNVIERWFSKSFLAEKQRVSAWKNMMERTPEDGYVGCCQAIAGADFTKIAGGIEVPVLAMAGSEDGSTPPDVVKATADLYGGEFWLIEGAGHLPCVEQPELVAEKIANFIRMGNE